MSILSFYVGSTGEVGYEPQSLYLDCNDSISTVSALNYLAGAIKQGFTVDERDIVSVIYGTTNNLFGLFTPTVDHTGVTLVPFLVEDANSNVFTYNNFQAGGSGNAATVASFPSTAASGSLVLAAVNSSGDYTCTISNASFGQSAVISIPDPGASTANFLLDTSSGGQTIVGNLTLSTGSLFITQGNATAGSSGHAGTFISYSSTASRGSLILAAVANTGNTNTTISNAAMGQATVVSIPDPGATTASFVLTKSAGTQTISSGSLAVAAGNITAGASGAAGTLASYSSTASRGSLKLVAVANSGNTDTTISNAAMGQASVVSIPDPGAATANFIISASAGTQTISTGSLAVAAGNITAGASGAAGTLTSYSSTAARGSFKFAAVANSGDTLTTLSNASMGQASVITIPDPGTATANVPVSVGTGGLKLGNVANTTVYPVVNVNITCGQAALAAAGSVTLLASSGSIQYRILNISCNSGGTNFSGGGGDRLGQVTDGTTVYSVVPAAQMQTLVNSVWGGTATPLPAGAAISTLTAAGTPVTFKYSGGATDYTAGSVVISVTAIQVA